MAVTYMPARAQGQVATLTGEVLDGLTAAPIRGAQVELVGTDLRVRTDLDGKFVLTTEPGTYQVRATLEGYFPYEAETLELAAGQRIVDLVLVKQEVQGETVTVTAQTPEASTQAAILLERRVAPTVGDAISAQEISDNGDSDAAGAMARVVGATVQADNTLTVRGLGDRYMSTTLLNGSLLPTPEADKRIVPLDLFPAKLIDNIKLEKTYSPDMPGEFGGAVVRMETVEFPSIPTLTVSYSSGFNSLTTFKDTMTYPGGNYDWAGFNDGRRNLPEEIPQSGLVRNYNPFTGRGFTAAELETMGESFENVWNPVLQSARPNQSFNVIAGNTWGKLGIVHGTTYGNKLQNRDAAQNYYRISGGAVTPWHTYTMSSGTNSVRLGSTTNLSYKLNENHKFLFKNFFSKDSSDETRTYTGYNDDFAENVFDQRLRYIEQTVYSGQVSGEHFIPALDGLFEWRLAYSRADRDEPDLREVLYLYNQTVQAFRFREDTQSGLRQFIESTDKIWEPGVDFTKFFYAGPVTGSFKVGASYTQRDRYFNSRKLRFNQKTSIGVDLTLDPESLFTPQYIGPNFELQEDTRATDHYLGDQDIKAGYGMVDVFLGSKWRVIGGMRFEDSVQILNSFDPFAADLTVIQRRREERDYLPSVNVIYALTPQQNIRAAYSQTLSRPNFRELAPFEFTDVTGGNAVKGNENLIRTQIDNYDLRWDYFPGTTEVISTSFFYKNFKDPIEAILEPTAQIRTTFGNVKSARNWGIETEVRKNLGGLSSTLQAFSVAGNYTFVSSKVDIGDGNPLGVISILTSTQRPLTGQSRHVVNASVEYTNPGWWGHTSRILYNMVGRRITNVGALQLPDVYQEGQHLLDLVVQQSLSETSPIELNFSIENILDDEKEFTQGGQPYLVYREGRTFSIGLSYQLF